MYKQQMAYECVCGVCNHKWIAGAIPKRCARCKSRIWDCDGAEPEAAEPVNVSRNSGVVVAVDPDKQPTVNKQEPEEKAARTVMGCQECGALSGHQKWCPKRK